MHQLRSSIYIQKFFSLSGKGTPDGSCVRWETGWPELTNRLASTAEERACVRSVRRQACAVLGIIPSEAALGDEFDAASNTKIFTLEEQCKPIGTIRVTLCPPPGVLSLPFAQEIAEFTKGASYLEVSHLAIDNSWTQADSRYVLALLQNVTAEADCSSPRYILAPMYTRHLSFYASIGFTQVSESLLLPGWPDAVILGCLDWRLERNRLRQHAGFRYIFSRRNPGHERLTTDSRSPHP